MAIYLDNASFGCGAFDLTGISAASGKVYAGQAAGAKTKDTDALAIDMSQWSGNYKDRSAVRLTTVTDIVGPTYVTVTFYYMKTSGGASSGAVCFDTHKIPLAIINGAKFTPLEFSLPSVGGAHHFVRMEVSADAAITAGAVLATIEATRL
jgi:hypothetical protein